MAIFSSKTKPCYDNDPNLKVKKELGKLKKELEEVVTRREDDTLSNKKIARIQKLSTGISRACVQFILVHMCAREVFTVLIT